MSQKQIRETGAPEPVGMGRGGTKGAHQGPSIGEPGDDMRRIAGTCVLLMGLSGCITVQREGTNRPNPGVPFAPSPPTQMTGGPRALPTGLGPAAPMPGASLAGAPTGPTPSTRVALVGAPGPAATVPSWLPPQNAPPYYSRVNEAAVAQANPVPAAPGSPASMPLVMTPRPPAEKPVVLAESEPAKMPVVMTPPVPAPQPVRPMIVAPGAESDETPPAPEDRHGRVVLTGHKAREPVETVTTSKPDEEEAPKPLPVMPVRTLAADEKASPEATIDQRPGAPLMRIVNSKRITLNFEVTDVGSSGVSGVEVWYTQDGKEWNKIDAPASAKSYVVGVEEEGTYGFTLLARSGIGLAHESPHPGDAPQMWVVVDLTRPAVELTEAMPSGNFKNQTVAIRWKATDKNLGRNPIRLSYAEKATGPWKTIASNLPNNGRYDWRVPTGAPARVLLRIEATDLGGNVGLAQTPKQVVLDTARPNVSILAVEPNAR